MASTHQESYPNVIFWIKDALFALTVDAVDGVEELVDEDTQDAPPGLGAESYDLVAAMAHRRGDRGVRRCGLRRRLPSCPGPGTGSRP